MLKTPKLSTTVVLHTVPGLKIDTDAVLHKMPLNDKIIKIEKRGTLRRGESKRDRIKRRNVTPTATSGFGHNSVTVVVMDDGGGTLLKKEITIKIFHNGVFHMTGVLDPAYETSVMSVLKTHTPEGCTEGEWVDSQRRVLLMNYSTAFEGTPKISRMALQRYFQERGIQAEFEPDVSPCVKIVFPKQGTACIFRTGKINLTALKSVEDCETLIALLTPHFEGYLKTLAVGDD